MANDYREPFNGGKFWTILHVEGEAEPSVLYRSKPAAERELARRRARDADDDDHADENHQIFACDIAGTIWNSYDPDPRENSPLTPAEIAEAHAH